MFSEIAYSCQIKENEEKENVFNVFNLFNLFKKNEMSTSAPNSDDLTTVTVRKRRQIVAQYSCCLGRDAGDS